MKPERESLAALSAVIDHDIAALRRLAAELGSLAAALEVPGCGFRELAAAGYLLHNLYNALENSFEQISRTFENHVVDRGRWHRELLDKMFLTIPDVRPAVMPETTRAMLHDLRGFRHLFRHGYSFELDRDRVHALASRWLKEQDVILAALGHFRDYLLSGQ
ncbi:MAG TPA: antitoxin [Verrucomicrobiota bacterium]|nr:antitoxin [Verrucomicrobiota bacterium]